MADVDADIDRLSDDLSQVEHCLECHKKNMSNLQQDMEKDTAQSNEEMDYLTRCIHTKRAKAGKIEQRIEEFKMSEDGPEQKRGKKVMWRSFVKKKVSKADAIEAVLTEEQRELERFRFDQESNTVL